MKVSITEDCIACGACAAVCPVGTIVVREHPAEIEIWPFKSRVKLIACERCGAPVVSELVVAQALERMALDSDELRERMRLCPKCRRSKTTTALASTAGHNRR